MTPDQLAAIAARNAARTQGKWKQHLVDDTTVVCGEKTICCTFPEGGLDDEVDFNTDTEQHENDAGHAKPKLSKEARQLLEEECQAREEFASTGDDKKAVTALRMLLNWHDQERLQP